MVGEFEDTQTFTCLNATSSAKHFTWVSAGSNLALRVVIGLRNIHFWSCELVL
jgi:hypothetical protein